MVNTNHPGYGLTVVCEPVPFVRTCNRRIVRLKHDPTRAPQNSDNRAVYDKYRRFVIVEVDGYGSTGLNFDHVCVCRYSPGKITRKLNTIYPLNTRYER